MIRINEGTSLAKYKSGKWIWNEAEEKLVYEPNLEALRDQVVNTNGFRFTSKLNQLDELIFLQEFQRGDTTHDADIILIQDIVNLVLFLSPAELLTKRFINFVHTHVIHKFLHALIIYFEYYLKMVEFVLIRRDEMAGEKAQLQSQESSEIRRIYSAQLSQYRLLLAREYSLILLGSDDEMRPYYHTTPIVNISLSIKDKRFHEGFLAFATQVVWIAMHHRAYDYIDLEMNRLFRSEHFRLSRYEHIRFSTVEASLLYGKNYKRVNYRAQTSPLIQELANVSAENQAILWIGKRKYRGTDLRIHQLELEYIVPDAQLSLIDISHGILGHPKKLYNTLLNLEWGAVRDEKYSETYDPYRIIRQPYLEVPNLDTQKIRKQCQRFQHLYHVKSHHEKVPRGILRKWTRRDEVINYFKTEGMLINVLMKCEKEANDTSYGPSVDERRTTFLKRNEKLRKSRGRHV